MPSRPVDGHLDLQSIQDNGPCTDCTLDRGTLGYDFGHFGGPGRPKSDLGVRAIKPESLPAPPVHPLKQPAEPVWQNSPEHVTILK